MTTPAGDARRGTRETSTAYSTMELMAVTLARDLRDGDVVRVGVAMPVVLGSVAITLLEIFVALLQAFIFTFLTTLFIGQAIVFHHDDHEEAAAH